MPKILHSASGDLPVQSGHFKWGHQKSCNNQKKSQEQNPNFQIFDMCFCRNHWEMVDGRHMSVFASSSNIDCTMYRLSSMRTRWEIERQTFKLLLWTFFGCCDSNFCLWWPYLKCPDCNSMFFAACRSKTRKRENRDVAWFDLSVCLIRQETSDCGVDR